MAHTATITVKLSDDLVHKLDMLAHITHRSKSFLALDAIEQYLEINEWQISEIKRGIVEADAGKVIEHKKIKRKWEKKLGTAMDKPRKPRS